MADFFLDNLMIYNCRNVKRSLIWPLSGARCSSKAIAVYLAFTTRGHLADHKGIEMRHEAWLETMNCHPKMPPGSKKKNNKNIPWCNRLVATIQTTQCTWFIRHCFSFKNANLLTGATLSTQIKIASCNDLFGPQAAISPDPIKNIKFPQIEQSRGEYITHIFSYFVFTFVWEIYYCTPLIVIYYCIKLS